MKIIQLHLLSLKFFTIIAFNFKIGSPSKVNTEENNFNEFAV